MNKKDKGTVDYWRKIISTNNVTRVNAVPCLLALIDRLNQQLAGVKEAGEPLLKEIEISAKILQKRFCAYGSVQGPGLKPSGFCDCKYIQVVRTGSTEETGCCESRQIILLSRRLAQVLKEIEDE